MGNETKDKRLEALEQELVLMVDSSNDEIADIDRRINELTQERTNKYLSSLEKINQQRGRIAERQSILDENAPQSNENATLSVVPGSRGPISSESQKEA